MDTLLQRIRDERVALEQQIVDLQKKVSALVACEEIFLANGTNEDEVKPVSSGKPVKPIKPTKPVKPANVPRAGTPTRAFTAPAKPDTPKHADIAEKILRERGPLTVIEIARLFEDEGRTTTANSLRTILSREKGKRFDMDNGGKWKMKKGYRGG